MHRAQNHQCLIGIRVESKAARQYRPEQLIQQTCPRRDEVDPRQDPREIGNKEHERQQGQ